jgi:hypothetical protein
MPHGTNEVSGPSTGLRKLSTPAPPPVPHDGQHSALRPAPHARTEQVTTSNRTAEILSRISRRRLAAARVTGYAGPRRLAPSTSGPVAVGGHRLPGPALLHGSVRSYERDRQPGETDNPKYLGAPPRPRYRSKIRESADACGKVTSRRVARGPIPVSMCRSCRRRLPGGR